MVSQVHSENNLKILSGAESFFFKRGRIGCLLCHGFTGTPKEMFEIGEFLAKNNITVYGPRLPGHGTNITDLISKNKEDWYGEYILAYQKLKENCDEIFVAGLSMGGVLTLKFASEHTVQGVISIATPVKFKPIESLLLGILGPFFSKAALKKNKKEMIAQEKYNILCYDSYPIGPAYSLRKLIHETKKKLGKITDPILVIQGLLDAKWIIRSSRIIIEEVNSSKRKMVSLKNSPHCLTVGPEKDKVSELILQFIQENSKFV
ncbi:MAG TPA: alpha/beta fold hydrolase [candidate division Zixibacteria bacterium]|nr:alpha/beta fold hydrolase [candidate division Zixibacteria bacterium]